MPHCCASHARADTAVHTSCSSSLSVLLPSLLSCVVGHQFLASWVPYRALLPLALRLFVLCTLPVSCRSRSDTGTSYHLGTGSGNSYVLHLHTLTVVLLLYWQQYQSPVWYY